MEVEILCLTDNDQPGWVECLFLDRHGVVYRFVEKCPLVTAEYLDLDSDYPRPGVVGRTILGRSDAGVQVFVEPINDEFECEVERSQPVDWDDPG